MDLNTRLFVAICLVASLFGAVACAGNDAAENPTGNIEGTVTVEGGGPAADALVGFQSRSDETRTGEEGMFTFEDIPTGTYTLRLSLQGYVTTKTDVEVSDGETAQPEITLQEVNEPPAIENVTLDPEILEPTGTSMVTVTASDPNPADTLSYTYSASGNFSVSGSGNTATVTAPDMFDAQGSVTVKVEDEEGRIARERLGIATAANSAPSISSLTATPSAIRPGGTSTVVVNASDAESDTLSYDWTSPSGWSIDDPTNAEIDVTAPDSYEESALLEVTVSDEHGFSTEATIGISTVVNNGPVISSVTASPATTERNGSISLGVSATDPNGDSLSYTWSAPSDWSLSSTSGQSPTLTAPSTPSTTATIEVVVEDTEGLSATGSVVVSTEPNAAPQIASVAPDNSELSRGGSTDVTVTATDPDEDTLSYSWSLGNSNWSFSGSGDTITVSAPNTPSSSTLVTVTVTDSVGASRQMSTIVETVPNQAPNISSVYATNNPVARGGSTTMNITASDPNGDSLTYSWSVDDSAWSITGNGSTATLNAPSTASASALVTVKVEDDLGASTSGVTQVSTAANKAPTITTLPSIPNTIPTGRVGNWTYDANASDPDDTNLTWSVNTSPSGLPATITSDGLLTLSPGRDFIDSTVTVQVSVSDGNTTTSQTFSVSTGSLEFKVAPSSSDGYSVAASDNVVGFGDFDGDGLSDVAGVNFVDYEISYILSSGSYSETIDVWPSGSRNFDNCAFARAARLDGDSSTDVVFGCDEDNSNNDDISLAIWQNDLGNMNGFVAGSSLNTGVTADVSDMVTFDQNDDDAAEIVLADSAESIHVFSNDGSGSLSAPQTINPTMPMNATSSWSIDRVFVSDVDADPEMEVVALESYSDSGFIRHQAAIFSFDGMGNLQSSRDTTVMLDGDPDKIDLADLNGDGSPDIVAKGQATSSFDWGVQSYINSGSGTFTKTGEVYDSALCNDTSNRGIEVGDVDGDGNADVVVGNDCDGSVHIAYGDGSGDFEAFIQTNQAAYGSDETENIYLGNFNSDGQLDIFAWEWTRMSMLY